MKNSRITLISEDEIISIDGKIYELGDSINSILIKKEKLHAIQWYGDKEKGEVEFNSDENKQNEKLEKYSDLIKYIDIKELISEMDRQDKIEKDKKLALETRRREYDYLRRRSYPSSENQLDSIIKSLKKIKEGGVDIGKEGEDLISEVDSIKKKYPKP